MLMNKNLNALPDVASLPPFEGKKILEVIQVSIPDEGPVTYKCVVSGGQIILVPASHFEKKEQP